MRRQNARLRSAMMRCLIINATASDQDRTKFVQVATKFFHLSAAVNSVLLNGRSARGRFRFTLEDLADEFGVSRVRQIEVRAFEKVQKAVKNRVAAMESSPTQPELAMH
jgi:DNA-directed RNA polymerase sigma subunit (sigma70/sigma32)